MCVCVCVRVCVHVHVCMHVSAYNTYVCAYHCVCIMLSIPIVQSDLEGQVAMEAYEESVILFTESAYDCALVNLKIKVRPLLKPGGFYHNSTMTITTAY